MCCAIVGGTSAGRGVSGWDLHEGDREGRTWTQAALVDPIVHVQAVLLELINIDLHLSQLALEVFNLLCMRADGLIEGEGEEIGCGKLLDGRVGIDIDVDVAVMSAAAVDVVTARGSTHIDVARVTARVAAAAATDAVMGVVAVCTTTAAAMVGALVLALLSALAHVAARLVGRGRLLSIVAATASFWNGWLLIVFVRVAARPRLGSTLEEACHARCRVEKSWRRCWFLVTCWE